MDHSMGITLLRHGMTAANERSAYIGWSNPSLSTTGRKKVEKLREQMNLHHIQNVFSSDLLRCIETAKILFPHHSIHEINNLRELHFGKWENQTYEQLKHLEKYRYWLDHPFESGPDGGEEFRLFQHRVKLAFLEMKRYMFAHSLNHVAVVTHGGVIRCLLSMLVQSEKAYFDWKIPYGSGYELCWTAEQLRREAKCTSLQEVPITVKPRG